jgi:hypothetical protein
MIVIIISGTAPDHTAPPVYAAPLPPAQPLALTYRKRYYIR